MTWVLCHSSGESRQGLQLFEPLPALQGMRSPALRWSLASDQGCACLDKAAGTFTEIRIEAPGQDK